MTSLPDLPTLFEIIGWDFDKLESAILLQLQKCIKPFEDRGDVAMRSGNPNEAILQYSSVLSLNLPNFTGLLVKRSKALAIMKLWEDALWDADDVCIPLCPTIANSTGTGNQGRLSESVGIREKTCGTAWSAAL